MSCKTVKVRLTLEAGIEQLGLHDALVGDAAVLLHHLPHLISKALLLVLVLGQQEGRESQQGGGSFIPDDDEEYTLGHNTQVTQHCSDNRPRSLTPTTATSN